jgi:hypothetical protein
MARFNVLEEELLNPKKMWKGFTPTLQSKLFRRLRESKGIIKTIQHLLPNTLCRHHHHHHHVYFHHCHDHHDNIELSPEPVSVNDRNVHKEVESKAAPVTAPPLQQQQQPPSTTKIEGHDEDSWQDHGNGSDYDEEENDEYILVGTPDSERLLLHGVNARSEKFIRSFYERLRLERQTTIEEEFEEILDHCS